MYVCCNVLLPAAAASVARVEARVYHGTYLGIEFPWSKEDVGRRFSPCSVTARSVFLALVVAWLSRILSLHLLGRRCGAVWRAPSHSDAGGGAVCIHKHCGFNPMKPAAVLSNGGCQPFCLVSGRVCLVGALQSLCKPCKACLLARAGVPFGILLASHVDWRSWHIVLVLPEYHIHCNTY